MVIWPDYLKHFVNACRPLWLGAVGPLLLVAMASAQEYSISTFAGGMPAPTPAQATSYFLRGPYGVVPDGSGNLYFTSQFNCVFKLSASGTLTIIGGNGSGGYSGDHGQAVAAQFSSPTGLALDNAGNLFVADTLNSVIRRIAPDGVVTTVAGNGTAGFSGDNGPATGAQLQYPEDVAVDSSGNLYIADTFNNRIRKVSANGTISTFAGSGMAAFSGDSGPATAAGLNQPWSVAVDGSGNMFIADYMNSRIRKVSLSGTISTVAGNGQRYFSGTASGDLGPYLGDGGPAIHAIIDPLNVRLDAQGNLYITDQFNGRIREVDASGVIRTAVGSSRSPQMNGDGGPATSASLNQPWSAAVDASGEIYIADYGHLRVRKVSTAGTIGTVAGDGSLKFGGDGGPARYALFSAVYGIATDPSGNLYVADSANNAVRKVALDGTISTVAGGPSAVSSSLSKPSGMLAASDGSLYIADTGNSRIVKISSGRAASTIAGTGVAGYNGDNIQAASAQLTSPYGLAFDRAGNLYIADYGASRIRKISTSGIISTVAGTGGGGAELDGVPATSAPVNFPVGLAVDSTGNLYIGEFMGRLRKVAPGGAITTVAGRAGAFTAGDVVGDGGPATGAFLRFFSGWIAIDGSDNLYLSEGPPGGSDPYGDGNNRIRKISKDGIINTIAGHGPANYSGDGGPATQASIDEPTGIALDSAGRVYFADQFTGYNVIRTLNPTPGIAISTPAALPSGNVGFAYSQNLAATGGTPPYRWNLTSGSMPTGLALSSTGVITGVPTSSGSFQFTIQAADSLSVMASTRFTLTISASPVIAAVVNAASGKSGPIAPGEIVVIYGTDLGPAQLTTLTLDSAGNVSTQLAGTVVRFNGTAAPIIYTSSTAVAAVVPYEISGNAVQAELSFQDQTSASFMLTSALSAPGIFTADSSGAGHAAGLNQDGSYNDATHPAPSGSVITLFVTGEGQTAPSGVDGKPASAPYPAPLLPVTVMIGGQPASVLYAGAAPGEVAGLMQLNVQVPDKITPGSAVDIRVTIGLQSTQQGVTIAVSGS